MPCTAPGSASAPLPLAGADAAADVAPVRTTRRRERGERSLNQLLRRVFHIDVFLCERGGQRRLLAAIFDPDAIRRILLHRSAARPARRRSAPGCRAGTTRALARPACPGWRSR